MADRQRATHARRGKADKRVIKEITVRAQKTLDGRTWSCPHCGTRTYQDVRLQGGDLDRKVVRVCKNKHVFRMEPAPGAAPVPEAPTPA